MNKIKPTLTDAAMPKNEGWAILHPNGWWEMDYFDMTEFRTRLDGYTKPQTPACWMKIYRPTSRLVRVKVIPVPLLAAHEAVAEAASFAETTLSAVVASQSHLPPAQRNQGLERLRKALAQLNQLKEKSK